MPFIGKSPKAGNFIVLDSITTSATATYNLTRNSTAYFPASARNLIVSLNGITQAPDTAYSVSGSTITFSSALTSSDVIDYILVLGDVLTLNTPADNTVGTNQMSYPLGNFSSTGIDDNATSTAITIDSNENVGIGTTSPKYSLDTSKAIYSGLSTYTGPSYGNIPGYLYLNGDTSGYGIVGAINSTQKFLLSGGSDTVGFLTYDTTGVYIQSDQARADFGVTQGTISFKTGSGFTERMRINTTGIVQGLWADNTTHNASGKFVKMTQAQYNAITPDSNTIYFIT